MCMRYGTLREPPFKAGGFNRYRELKVIGGPSIRESFRRLVCFLRGSPILLSLFLLSFFCLFLVACNAKRRNFRKIARSYREGEFSDTLRRRELLLFLN